MHKWASAVTDAADLLRAQVRFMAPWHCRGWAGAFVGVWVESSIPLDAERFSFTSEAPTLTKWSRPDGVTQSLHIHGSHSGGYAGSPRSIGLSRPRSVRPPERSGSTSTSVASDEGGQRYPVATDRFHATTGERV